MIMRDLLGIPLKGFMMMLTWNMRLDRSMNLTVSAYG